MKVSTRSWHGRAYRWWCHSDYTGWRWNFDNDRRSRDNLCHYVRVVLLYAPLLWLATARPWRVRWLRPWMPPASLATVAFLALAVVRWPVGTWYVVWVMLLCIAGGAAGVGVSGGIVYVAGRRKRRRQAAGAKERSPSFARVAWEFIKAKKRRMCPFIEVVDE